MAPAVILLTFVLNTDICPCFYYYFINIIKLNEPCHTDVATEGIRRETTRSCLLQALQQILRPPPFVTAMLLGLLPCTVYSPLAIIL
jgi:hypothetical protein